MGTGNVEYRNANDEGMPKLKARNEVFWFSDFFRHLSSTFGAWFVRLTRSNVMSVENTANFKQVGNGHASSVLASGDSAGAMSRACRGHDELNVEPEPLRQHAHASVEHRTPTPTSSQQARGVLNESADEDALRMRTEGLTYREIGIQLGVDPSMAHRRVKRQVMRQKTLLNEKLEDVRDVELEKLRMMERALMRDANAGDHNAIKLVLRIMDMRRKYLKDIPLEHAEEVPWFEDSASLFDEGGEGVEESQGQGVEGDQEQGMSQEAGEDDLYDEEDEGDDITPEEEAWMLYRPKTCLKAGIAYKTPDGKVHNAAAFAAGACEDNADDDPYIRLAKQWYRSAKAAEQRLTGERVAANGKASKGASTAGSKEPSTRASMTGSKATR